METLGSAASIIAIVEIAASIAKLCGRYISDVKDARQDIEALQQKAAALSDVLQRLAGANDQKSSKPLILSDNVRVSVEQCSQDLQTLQGRLQPKNGHRKMRKFGRRALMWPLSKAEVNEEVKKLEGYLTAFNTALLLVHMYAFTRMY